MGSAADNLWSASDEAEFRNVLSLQSCTMAKLCTSISSKSPDKVMKYVDSSLRAINKLLRAHKLSKVDRSNDQACLSALRVWCECRAAGTSTDQDIATALAHSVKLGKNSSKVCMRVIPLDIPTENAVTASNSTPNLELVLKGTKTVRNVVVHLLQKWKNAIAIANNQHNANNPALEAACQDVGTQPQKPNECCCGLTLFLESKPGLFSVPFYQLDITVASLLRHQGYTQSITAAYSFYSGIRSPCNECATTKGTAAPTTSTPIKNPATNSQLPTRQPDAFETPTRTMPPSKDPHLVVSPPLMITRYPNAQMAQLTAEQTTPTGKLPPPTPTTPSTVTSSGIQTATPRSEPDSDFQFDRFQLPPTPSSPMPNLVPVTAPPTTPTTTTPTATTSPATDGLPVVNQHQHQHHYKALFSFSAADWTSRKTHQSTPQYHAHSSVADPLVAATTLMKTTPQPPPVAPPTSLSTPMLDQATPKPLASASPPCSVHLNTNTNSSGTPSDLVANLLGTTPSCDGPLLFSDGTNDSRVSLSRYFEPELLTCGAAQTTRSDSLASGEGNKLICMLAQTKSLLDEDTTMTAEDAFGITWHRAVKPHNKQSRKCSRKTPPEKVAVARTKRASSPQAQPNTRSTRARLSPVRTRSSSSAPKHAK